MSFNVFNFIKGTLTIYKRRSSIMNNSAISDCLDGSNCAVGIFVAPQFQIMAKYIWIETLGT